jgi:hypothetical protein
VALDASPDGLHLAVRNTLRDGQRPSPGDGTGLTGMAARATQMGAELRAGVDGDTWLVDVVVPLGTRLATR